MIEAGAEHRRWPAVVLRRPEDDDGIHRPALVLEAHDQNHHERDGVGNEGRKDENAGKLEGAAEDAVHGGKLRQGAGDRESSSAPSRYALNTKLSPCRGT